MVNKEIKISSNQSQKETNSRREFFEIYRNCPIPDEEVLSNLGLFIKRQDLKRILFMNELYKKIIDVSGVIIEFGVRWGQNLALFESCRGIYEPHNYNRKIVGFDTFEGFPNIHEKDGKSDIISNGNFSVTDSYENYLRQILDYHEQESPVSHIKKYQLVKGDASEEIERYLREHPETVIALAYFDMDLYEPTKKCLEAIKGHLTKGSVIGFDELNTHVFPGETIALKEVFGLDKYKLARNCYCALQSYIIIT